MTVQAAYAMRGNKQAMIVFFFWEEVPPLKTPHVEISSLTVTDVMLVYKEGRLENMQLLHLVKSGCEMEKEYNSKLPGHDFYSKL